MARKTTIEGSRSPTTDELWGQLTLGNVWLVAFLAATTGVVASRLLYPQELYARFVWRHFVGPLFVDANGALCGVYTPAGTNPLYSADACQAAVNQGRLVAQPGYTPVSTVGYVLVSLFVIVGILQLLRRFDVGRERRFVYSLIPFVMTASTLFVLREIEQEVSRGAVGYPVSVLVSGPLVYATAVFLALFALVVSVVLARAKVIDRYDRGLKISGLFLLGLLLGWLYVVAVSTGGLAFTPIPAVAVLVFATVLSVVLWAVVARAEPYILSGTGSLGLVVLWAYTIDGVTSVIAVDGLRLLGLSARDMALSPLTIVVMRITELLLPSSLTVLLGTAWPLVIVKIFAALLFVWVIDSEVFEGNPRLATLLTLIVLSVGLLQGTNWLLRMTFGL